MTPAEIIVEARKLLQDTRIPFRYSDTELLGYVNQTLKRVLTIRPDLFTQTSLVPLQPGDVLQSLPADAHRLVDIYYVDGYNSVNEVERPVFERAYPQWVSDAAGIPLNFIRHARNPTKFFVYPRPVEGLSLVAEYVATPANYDLNDDILAPGAGYFSAVVDGVVFLASSIDDEHVSSGRAKLFLDSFLQALSTDLQSRIVTDDEEPSVSDNRR
jgi:hypothetical protein